MGHKANLLLAATPTGGQTKPQNTARILFKQKLPLPSSEPVA
jgi:hypothetical protein